MAIIQYSDEGLTPSKSAIIRWFGFDQFIPERAFTSYWVSTKTFFIIRFILALYTTVVFWPYIGLLASAKSDFSGFFSAFTILTYIGLHSYLLTACVYHFRYLRSKSVDFLLNQPAILNYLYVYLYSTIVTYNIVTPVVFWSILSKGSSSNAIANWLNISVHGVSFFLMIFDVVLNRMKLPIRMVLFVFFTVVFYMFLTFIHFADKHTWVYPFLDWNQGPSAAIWYFAVGIIVVVAFFVMVLIHLLRDLIARKTGKLQTAVIGEKQEEDNFEQVDMTKIEKDRSSAA